MAPLADVVVLAPDQPLFAAAVELMQSQAGRGVVVAGGRLVGLLTVKDLSRPLEISRLAGGRPVAPHRSAAR
jgi:CBS domain